MFKKIIKIMLKKLGDEFIYYGCLMLVFFFFFVLYYVWDFRKLIIRFINFRFYCFVLYGSIFMD